MVEPGTHGSTYGGNPLGCAVSLRALELIEEEDMIAKAEKLGNIFRDGVASIKSPIVQKVRGKGLLNAVVIDESAANGRSAWDLCVLLKEKGLLVSSSPISADFLVSRLGPSPIFTAWTLHRAPASEASGDSLTRDRRNRHMETLFDSLPRWSLQKRN